MRDASLIGAKTRGSSIRRYTPRQAGSRRSRVIDQRCPMEVLAASRFYGSTTGAITFSSRRTPSVRACPSVSFRLGRPRRGEICSTIWTRASSRNQTNPTLHGVPTDYPSALRQAAAPRTNLRWQVWIKCHTSIVVCGVAQTQITIPRGGGRRGRAPAGPKRSEGNPDNRSAAKGIPRSANSATREKRQRRDAGRPV